MELIITTATSLFFVMNTLGNIPLFIAILGRFDLKRQRIIILREMIFAFAIMLLFNFFGNGVLNILGITQPIIKIAGGFLLIIIALGMIFPKPISKEISMEEPMFIPLAMPVTVGPGTITAIMIFSKQIGNHWIMLASMTLAWIPSVIALLVASNIKRILGDKGLVAIEKLGGMIVTLIAVQMVSSGIIELVKNQFN